MRETAGSKMRDMMLEANKAEASSSAVEKRIIKLLTGWGYNQVRYADDTYKNKSFATHASNPTLVQVYADDHTMRSIQKQLAQVGYRGDYTKRGIGGASGLAIKT